MDCIGDKRSYPEYNYMTGKSIMVGLILGRLNARTESIYGEIYQRQLKANDVNVLVGDTGTGKSVTVDAGRLILQTVQTSEIFIPKCAPETLAKELADFKIITQLEKPKRKGKKKGKEEQEEEQEEELDDISTKTKEVATEIELPKVKYPRAWRVFWNGEFGSFLASTNKPYMAGIIEDFCDYYTGNIETKIITGETKGSNVKYKFRDDLFFAIYGAMTPKSLEYLDTEHIEKGLTRWTWYDGSDLKPLEIPENSDIKELSKKQGDLFKRTEEHLKTKGRAKDDYKLRCLIKGGIILSELLNDHTIEVFFSPEATELIKNRQKNMLRLHHNDRTMLTIMSRDMEKIYKECIAVEYGNVLYYLLENQEKIASQQMGDEIKLTETHKDLDSLDGFYDALSKVNLDDISNIRLKKMIITPETAKFVLKMQDRIYLSSMVSICQKIREQDKNVNKTVLEKVIKAFESANRISKDDVPELLNKSLENYKKETLKKKTNENAAEIEKAIAEAEIKCQVENEYFKGLDDDFVITTLTKRELNRNKLQRVPLTYIEEAIQALKQKSAVISIPLPKGAIQYLYIPVTSELQFPNDNYREYAGSGTYQSGLMFYKMYTVVETGKSTIGNITEDVLSDMIEKSKDIEVIKG